MSLNTDSRLTINVESDEGEVVNAKESLKIKRLCHLVKPDGTFDDITYDT